MISLKITDLDLLDVDWKNIIRINSKEKENDLSQEEGKLNFLFI